MPETDEYAQIYFAKERDGPAIVRRGAADFHPARPIPFGEFAELIARREDVTTDRDDQDRLRIGLDGKNFLYATPQADGTVVFSRYGDDDVEPILRKLDGLLNGRIGPEHERDPVDITRGDPRLSAEIDEVLARLSHPARKRILRNVIWNLFVAVADGELVLIPGRDPTIGGINGLVEMLDAEFFPADDDDDSDEEPRH